MGAFEIRSTLDAPWEVVWHHATSPSGIEGASLQVVAGAGHMLPLERPEVVASALAEWLEASSRWRETGLGWAARVSWSLAAGPADRTMDPEVEVAES